MRTSLLRPLGILSLGLAAVLAGPLPSAGQTVDFGSERWTVTAGRVQEHLGRQAFQGTAFLNDVPFGDGTIEVDVAVASDRARSYPGILFRIAPGQNWERFYIRPHRQILYADTLQYVPAYNGVDSWQLYSGPGFTAGAAIPVNSWFRVRIEVSGDQARVFIGDSAEPALRIPRLSHGRSVGALGVMGPVDGSAFFSRFSFRQADLPAFDDMPPPDVAPGAIVDWQVSKAFRAGRIELDRTPEEQGLDDPGWRTVKAEAGGLVDIGRLYPRSGEPDAVFARTVLTAETEEARKVDIGYSDIVSVFLNGRLLFEANSQYQGRDSSFLGVAGYFDSLLLPLKKGENELLLAVAEVSGGWGFKVRDGLAAFVLEGLKKAWETPKTFSVPESVAYDEARKCLYVSNYDGYRPSPPGEGRQSISKVGLDGTVVAVDWVTGLRNPTGLCVVGDRLWAVERGGLAEIDIPGAKVLGRVPLPGSVMPNDVAAAADGALYVTDSAKSAIYRVAGGKAEEWLSGPGIGRPNGIAVRDGKLIVGTSVDGCLKSVDLATRSIGVIARLGAGIIDGIQALPMNRYLVSHNEGRLYLVRDYTPIEGTVSKVLDLTVPGRNIADFFYVQDGRNSLIVFPTFVDGRLEAYAAPLPIFMSHVAKEDRGRNDRQRDAVHKIDKGLDTLGIAPGMTVGEVGAGDGYLALKLASRVGPTGRVIAEDIFPSPLEELRDKAGELGFRTIETILGKPEDPLLPRGALDLVFMHATIKFVKDAATLFGNIAPALKPEGRIVVIEPERGHRDMYGRPLPEQEYRSREGYLELFAKAGLRVVRVDDKTLPNLTIFVLSAS
ncbi:MAG: methyltransferase domain-containing protein [Candidatus Aminicenantes bacterium]